MEKKINEYLADIKSFSPKTLNEIEAFRIKYLGKKGLIGGLFSILKTASIEEKKRMGQLINQLKQAISSKIEYTKNQISYSPNSDENLLDLTRPGYPFEIGSRHPISILKNKIVDIFGSVGFSLSEGPEIEDDWHNFTALNLPNHHPARDMQDTFFIQKSPDYVLRTHTSSVQVRYMESQSPPIRTISPGRVFRNEVISARSHCLFHQVEGLVIDKDVSFADLKQMISFFVKSFFGKSKMRFRPSYFPFTEPSAEVDIYWGLNTESDYRITKGTGWLEILGCGMVHPNVLKNCGIDPELHSGYAFGMGLERMAMLLYNITDIRSFYENSLHFLSQFRTELV